MKNLPDTLQGIAIVGPTATGKTAVGVELARTLNTEVISVDSQQVYQEVLIGVATPTSDEMQGVVHHMLGVIPPTTACTAGDYADLARPIFENMLASKKMPILVGGTGFYLRSLLTPDHLPPVPSDPDLRTALNVRLQQEGAEAMYAELVQKDPERAKQLHVNDTVRVVRALEVIALTGAPVTPTPTEFSYNVAVFGLMYRDLSTHDAKIRKRLLSMMDDGFLEEVKTVYTKYGMCAALQKAHGYPELVDVLENRRTLEDALIQIELNIKRYSRRQMTWFRKIPGIQWIEVDDTTPPQMASDILSRIA